jgi:hypothetical protein
MMSEAFAFRSHEAQIDLNPPAVDGRVRPVDADEGRQAFHVRILQNDFRQRLLPVGHRVERDALLGFRYAQNGACVLNREESLRYIEV